MICSVALLYVQCTLCILYIQVGTSSGTGNDKLTNVELETRQMYQKWVWKGYRKKDKLDCGRFLKSGSLSGNSIGNMTGLTGIGFGSTRSLPGTVLETK